MEVRVLAWVRGEERKNLVKLIIADVEESFVKLHNYVEWEREEELRAVKFQSKSLVKFSINKVNGSHLTSRSIKSKSFLTRLQRRQRRLRHRVSSAFMRRKFSLLSHNNGKSWKKELLKFDRKWILLMTHEIAAIFHLTVQQFSSLKSRGFGGGKIDRENLFLAWQLKLSSARFTRK